MGAGRILRYRGDRRGRLTELVVPCPYRLLFPVWGPSLARDSTIRAYRNAPSSLVSVHPNIQPHDNVACRHCLRGCCSNARGTQPTETAQFTREFNGPDNADFGPAIMVLDSNPPFGAASAFLHAVQKPPLRLSANLRQNGNGHQWGGARAVLALVTSWESWRF